MKTKYFLSIILAIQGMVMFAQVGVNNNVPVATLDVVGNTLVQEKLYLGNPGNYDSNASFKLLLFNPGNGIISKYDIASSSFGPLNYVQFAFKRTSNFGLDNGYNTKIDATKYTVAVNGFYFNDRGNTNVTLRSTNNTSNIEGQQFYAYVSGGTWWIKAFGNNSRFYLGTNLTYVDIYLDLIIYRNNFITKIWDAPQVINMGQQATKTAPLPPGF